MYKTLGPSWNEKRLADVTKALRLSLLGWTDKEIAARLGVSRETAQKDGKKFSSEEFTKTLGPSWNEKRLADVAGEQGLPLQDIKNFSSEEFNKTLGVTKSQAHRDSKKFNSEDFGKTLGQSFYPKIQF